MKNKIKRKRKTNEVPCLKGLSSEMFSEDAVNSGFDFIIYVDGKSIRSTVERNPDFEEVDNIDPEMLIKRAYAVYDRDVVKAYLHFSEKYDSVNYEDLFPLKMALKYGIITALNMN